MPGLDDYHAFISTTSGSSGSRKTSGGNSGGGDSGFGGCLTWVAAIISSLWIIGKLIG